MADAKERYVFIKKLAEGGMADVFLARDVEHTPPRLCVVKQLLADLRSKKDHVAMFLDEADLAVRLAHPNVVRALDRGSSREGPFLVLEYLAGFDLDLVIERLREVGAQAPWQLGVQIIIAAAEGMAYAHALTGADGKPLHLVHRDLTPSNIFITFDGVVKVLDFGIARADARRTRTSTGMLKGKARYLAPEQIQQLPADGRVDQFSLGAALFEVLTLRPLFLGDNELAVIHAIVDGARPSLTEARPDLPPAVEEVFLRMTAQLREDRYPSMKEVAAALRAVLPPDDQRSVLSAFMRQHFGPDFMAHASLMGRLASASTSELRAYFEKGVNLAEALEHPSREQKTVVAVGQAIPDEARRTPMGVAAPSLELPSLEGEPVSAPLRLPDEVVTEPEGLIVARRGRPESSPRAPPRAGSPWLALGVAAVVLVGAGVAWRSRTRPAPVLRGSLVVRSQPPGATIRLDGAKSAFTTPAAFADLAVGRHELVLEHPEALPTTLFAEVSVGQQQTLDVALPTKEGLVLLDVSPPDAVVTIDGTTVELDGGLGQSQPLTQGTYRLEVRALGYRPNTRQFVIDQGQRLPMQVALEPDPIQ